MIVLLESKLGSISATEILIQRDALNWQLIKKIGSSAHPAAADGESLLQRREINNVF